MPRTQVNADPLPQRDEADRCDSVEAGRRCVLPAAHGSGHVYPPTQAGRDTGND
ncbi:hypothetical protein HII36_41415 [Nonomuraea sp. NN258]|uniref:hypothetical protein n=1 Tax=Nonomuraea antri TaxID=2730852 RepID=UPI001569818A|nr:hypothetical protein [Nonomuraea antri]NRQ38246.1 hypothetical protein [Nonomuraea antri]